MTEPTKSARDWDARYQAVEGGLFGESANEYLRMFCARSDFMEFNTHLGQACRVLCLADGDGRNGTWLAQCGYEVTAVDHSAEATRRAIARDQAAGVTVERITADLSDWMPEAGRTWDFACILYLHGTRALRERAVRLAYETLTHDGWFLLEGFSKAQADRDAMGPDDPDKLYDGKELRIWLSDALVIEATSGRLTLEEGRRHAGEAEVERLVARRRFSAGSGVNPADVWS
ncbi:class I SAM-dependent methyltransferase [Denitrobaculum tricleocarpae]|uniref:Class I SAM-dependent methyltransferase n=1 Tax=Denitrobaculum tricleocarpae TaxID=2591009 RepID=A0A545TL08_9PROT|nr:class I SAM-dependent methyltransferase [Denitrobaculum tricleocarpae]TQV77887.1 class I SAM-dependent methyltransferase [Denitrobaculum tricleocarpae]